MATDTANTSAFDAALYAELDELAELEADWDQQGAYAIEPEIITSTRRLLRSLDGTVPTPHIAPTSNGSIILEWSRDHRKKRLKLTFENATQLRFLRWEPRYDMQDTGRVAVSELSAINGLLHWFMSGSELS